MGCFTEQKVGLSFHQWTDIHRVNMIFDLLKVSQVVISSCYKQGNTKGNSSNDWWSSCINAFSVVILTCAVGGGGLHVPKSQHSTNIYHLPLSIFVLLWTGSRGTDKGHNGELTNQVYPEQHHEMIEMCFITVFASTVRQNQKGKRRARKIPLWPHTQKSEDRGQSYVVSLMSLFFYFCPFAASLMIQHFNNISGLSVHLACKAAGSARVAASVTACFDQNRANTDASVTPKYLSEPKLHSFSMHYSINEQVTPTKQNEAHILKKFSVKRNDCL